MTNAPWTSLAERQQGLIARRQLRRFNVDADQVRNRIAAQRWMMRTDRVVSLFTGPLTFDQRLWLAALHAGGDALIGGLTAGAVQGLRNWERDTVAVQVDDRFAFEPVPGVQFVRTRRPLRELRDPHHDLPVCRIEPAVLLFAGYQRSARTAQGLIAATVQQRLSTPRQLRDWVHRLRPLRRAQLFRDVLADIEGGSQSLGELDVVRFCRQVGLPLPNRQRRRRDRSGRNRFTDCEWDLPDGRVVVLEVDGSFHMDAQQWEEDMARERALTSPVRMVLRCTTRELRDEPHLVFRDLAGLGVGQTPGRLPRDAS